MARRAEIALGIIQVVPPPLNLSVGRGDGAGDRPGREAGGLPVWPAMAATKVSARFSAPTPSFWCS